MQHNQNDDEWTPERVYKRVKRAIIAMQAGENPTDTMLVCRVRDVRLSLCANGSIPTDLFDQAVKMLVENNDIAAGDEYACHPADAQMAREAIEYVAEQEPTDKKFIGNMNQLLSNGDL